MVDYPTVCVIGAGSSGIAAAKVLYQTGIPFDCYEKGDRVGGNWVFQNKNGMSSAYRSLHINTSRDKMAYSDYPMPEDYPDYPHHAQVADYFDGYVDRFGFRDQIQFNTGVAHAALTEDRYWRVQLENGAVKYYDALCVANGHHWDPRMPDPPFEGTFSGDQFHSHSYIDPRDPVDMLGKRVVIVGFGNSALDLACELGRKEMCSEVYLSMRRGYWVIPRYFGPHVLDFHVPHPSEDPPLLSRLLPRWWLMRGLEKRLANIVGRPEDHGLPKPDHQLGATHPAISQDIYNRIGSGDVIPKPNIARFDGTKVHFVDDTQVEADVVIYCTGYNIQFPFFDEAFLSAPNNDIALWQRMMVPSVPNLFFIALVQPLCAMMPIAEEQSKLMAHYLRGDYLLPSRAQMEKERAVMHEGIKNNYISTARHTIQIECGDYTRRLRQEIRAGMKRAQTLDYPLPVEPAAFRHDEKAGTRPAAE